MLRTRVATAVVLLSLFLLALFGLPATGFALLLSAVCVLAAWEWSRLCHAHPGVTVAALTAIGVIVILWPATGLWAVAAGVAWWVWCLWRLGTEPESGSRGLCYLQGILILLPAWSALVWLRHDFGPYGVLAVLVTVWLADSGAYFCGKRWGRRKLAPRVSPGKTVEGLVGGLGTVGLFALASASWAVTGFGVSRWSWLGLCLAAGVFSVIGDLVESKAKRAAGVKDSGALLPGHGGVLDRIDGALAAAPVFALGLHWVSTAA